MIKVQPSPCKSCTRVKDPINCQMKTCAIWHDWFVRRWDEFNATAKACGLEITPIVQRGEDEK